MKYLIVVDFGKPYDIHVDSDKDLKKELFKLKRMAYKNIDKYAYFDVIVYHNDKDVTDKVFKKYGLDKL